MVQVVPPSAFSGLSASEAQQASGIRKLIEEYRAALERDGNSFPAFELKGLSWQNICEKHMIVKGVATVKGEPPFGPKQ